MKTRPHWLLPSSSVALIGYTHSSDLLSLPLSLSVAWKCSDTAPTKWGFFSVQSRIPSCFRYSLVCTFFSCFFIWVGCWVLSASALLFHFVPLLFPLFRLWFWFLLISFALSFWVLSPHFVCQVVWVLVCAMWTALFTWVARIFQFFEYFVSNFLNILFQIVGGLKFGWF